MERKNVVYFQFSKLKNQSEQLEMVQDSLNEDLEINVEDIIEISDDNGSIENEIKSAASSIDLLDVEALQSEEDDPVIILVHDSSSNETIHIPTAKEESNPERSESAEIYEQYLINHSKFLEMKAQSMSITNNSAPLELPEHDPSNLQEFSFEQEFPTVPKTIKQQSNHYNLPDLISFCTDTEPSSVESSSDEEKFPSKKIKNKGKSIKKKQFKYPPDFDIFEALPWPFEEKIEPQKSYNEVNNESNTSQQVKTEPTSSEQSNPKDEINKDVIFIDLTLDDDDE